METCISGSGSMTAAVHGSKHCGSWGQHTCPLSPRNAGYMVACLSEQGGLADGGTGGASHASWLVLLSGPGSFTGQQAQLPKIPESWGLGSGL